MLLITTRQQDNWQTAIRIQSRTIIASIFLYGSDNWLAMQYNLMVSDYNARNNSIADDGGTGELTYSETNTIHTTAFGTVGLPPEAFTLYTPTNELANVDPNLAQATFEDMLTNAGSGGALFLDGIAMNDLLGSWAPTINIPYWEWIGEIVKTLLNHPGIAGTEIESIINGFSPAQIAEFVARSVPRHERGSDFACMAHGRASTLEQRLHRSLTARARPDLQSYRHRADDIQRFDHDDLLRYRQFRLCDADGVGRRGYGPLVPRPQFQWPHRQCG